MGVGQGSMWRRSRLTASPYLGRGTFHRKRARSGLVIENAFI